MRNLIRCVPHTHTVKCIVLGLFTSLLVSGMAQANNANPSAVSAFKQFRRSNGDNWISQWNNQTGHSQAVITWGSGFKGSARVNFSINHPSVSISLNSDTCVKPTSPALPPICQEDQKLSILQFSAVPSVVSSGTGYTDTVAFKMGFAVKHTNGLEGQRHGMNDMMKANFYIAWQIIIKDSSNTIVNTLKGTTFVNPSNCIQICPEKEDMDMGHETDEETGMECRWIGANAVRSFTPVSFNDGVYSYKLMANLYRKMMMINTKAEGEHKSHTMLIASAKTGIGTFIVDSTPPTVTITSPPADSVLNNSYPQITVDYHDNLSCIDKTTFSAVLDYTDVTSSFMTTDTSASFNPSYALSDGIHNIDASIRDMAGNTGTAKEDFSIFTGSNSGAYQGVVGFLQTLAPVFGYPADLHDLRLTYFMSNFSGTTYIYSMYEFDQYVNGIPVLGGQLKVAVNVNYQPIALLGNYYPGVTNINTTPGISADTARNIAIADQDITDTTTAINMPPMLKIIPNATSGKLIWDVMIHSRNVYNIPQSYTYLIDANTGVILTKWSNAAYYSTYTGTGYAFIFPPYILNFLLLPAFWSVSLPNLLTNNGCLDGLYATICDSNLISGGHCIQNCIPKGYNNGIIYNDMPDILNTLPGPQTTTNSDILTDMVTAYYNVNRIAERLSHATSFQMKNYQNTDPTIPDTQIFIETNVGDWTKINPTGDIDILACSLANNNAQTISHWDAEDRKWNGIEIDIGMGCYWTESTIITSLIPFQTKTVYLLNDFTRDPNILWHEYGHAILFDKGVQDPCGLISSLPNSIYCAYHEGFADTNAFFMSGNPKIGEWLVNPYMRDADNTTFQPQWFSVNSEAHAQGEVYSGAMWDLRSRMMNTYGLSSDQVWWLDVNATSYVSEIQNAPLDFSFILQSLFTANELEWYWAKYLCQFGIIRCPLDPWHEIEGAFARHGVLQSSRVAIAIPEIGEGKNVDPTQSPVNFTIYSGANTSAQLYFYNSDGSVCNSTPVVSTNPSLYHSSSVYPGCSTIVPGYNQGCAVYNAASELSNCQKGKVTFVAQTCNGSSCINSTSDGPPQYIDKTGGCEIIPEDVNLPLATMALNMLFLFIPVVFPLFIKRRINKRRRLL